MKNMDTKTQKPEKTRAINTGPESDVAQLRYSLYRSAHERVAQAQQDGYYLEAITLLESMLCDRMEARLAAIHSQEPTKRQFNTLVALAQELSGKKSGEDADVKAVYRSIEAWASRRNELLHQLAKVSETDLSDWDEKYSKSKQAVDDGLELLRSLSNEVKRLNKHTGQE
jgi:hypothetical protein